MEVIKSAIDAFSGLVPDPASFEQKLANVLSGLTGWDVSRIIKNSKQGREVASRCDFYFDDCDLAIISDCLRRENFVPDDFSSDDMGRMNLMDLFSNCYCFALLGRSKSVH
jgi:hypothetical protein